MELKNTPTPAASTPPRARRPRTTRRRIIWIDRAMVALIRFGGMAVILAVTGILAYLLIVVEPLFREATLTRVSEHAVLDASEARDTLLTEVDEYRSIGVSLLRTGEMVVFNARTGDRLDRRQVLSSSAEITSLSHPAHSDLLALGLMDGTVLTGRLTFETAFLDDVNRAPSVARLRAGDTVQDGASVVQRTVEGDLRRVKPVLSLQALPASPPPGAAAIRLLDYRGESSGERLAMLRTDGSLEVQEVVRRENMLTGETVTDAASNPVPAPREIGAYGSPAFMLLTTKGDQLYIAWSGGTAVRYDLRDPAAPEIVERTDLVPEPGVSLTAMTFSLGEQSILTGDTMGRVRAWFRPRLPSTTNPDGHALVLAHAFERLPAAVTTIGTSRRDKTLIAGTTDGRGVLFHATSEQKLGEGHLGTPSPLRTALLASKGDGVFLLGTNGMMASFDLHNPHPETTLRSLFGHVWYEGYPEAAYTWQSSSGTDDFEPKFSLVPLIFGTLKATVYSLLFAVPIALLAAVYTSEFLSRTYRGPLKSIVEMMASLPSVVLGFIAALVLAPIIERRVLPVLLACALIPIAALCLGHTSQILPRRITNLFNGRAQLGILVVSTLSALFAASPVAAIVERTIFRGDFKAWLDGRAGTGTPGLILLLWPIVFAALLVADSRWLSRFPKLSTPTAGGQLGRFISALFLSMLSAAALGSLGGALGLDPRGSLVGTYVQRNALVVGFVMGFAVIPIIYTIAEDALTAVPSALRSASLACGASRWQTATRVILPVAIPGIFSAVMIGLGRAAGETMIVLMAAGNTPVLEMNIFGGLRTLSANIAVELPEAVKDGTLYRVLFLAALTLFAMTFCINTVAELVRQRFRKRALQL